MPVREGFYSGGAAQAAGAGGFAGLQDYFGQLLGERLKDRQSNRELKRQEQAKLFNDVLGKVQSGEHTPEEAQALTGVPADKFRVFVPSNATMMSKLNTMLKPGMSAEEANVQTHSLGPFRNLPDIVHNETATGPEYSAALPFLDPTKADLKPQLLSQQIASLLSGRTAEADSSKPVTKIGESADVGPTFGEQSYETEQGNQPNAPLGGDVTPVSLYGRFNPRTKTMDTLSRVPSGPSAVTKGFGTGLEEQAAAPGKGIAQTNVLNAIRPAQVETTRQNAQANEDVRIAPSNVRGEANRASSIEFAQQRARDNAIQAGIPKEVADSFVHGTTTGKSYLFFPQGTDHNIISVTSRRLAADPATKGIRIVGQQDHAALQAIQTARDNFGRLVSLVKNHLATDYKGNIIQAPANYLAKLSAEDPEIRTLATADYPQLIQALRAIAGPFGRVTQQEINRAAGTLPQINEPIDTLVEKYKLFFDTLENTENNILR